MRVTCFRTDNLWSVYSSHLQLIAQVERIALTDVKVGLTPKNGIAVEGTALASWGATFQGEPEQEGLDALGIGRKWPLISPHLRLHTQPLNAPLTPTALAKLITPRIELAELAELEAFFWSPSFADITDAELV